MNTIQVIACGADNSFVRRVQHEPEIAVQMLAALKEAEWTIRSHIMPDHFDGHAARALLLVRTAIETCEANK